MCVCVCEQGEKDWQKYETARRLKKCVDRIRTQYREDWKSKEMRIRQRAVALYFIDKVKTVTLHHASVVAHGHCLFLCVMTASAWHLQLALRAGNEKEEGETADTVGCCSLRVEHINLYPKLEDQEYVVEFDFLGKDSIRYYNKIPVEKRVRAGHLLCSGTRHPKVKFSDFVSGLQKPSVVPGEQAAWGRPFRQTERKN